MEQIRALSKRKKMIIVWTGIIASLLVILGVAVNLSTLLGGA